MNRSALAGRRPSLWRTALVLSTLVAWPLPSAQAQVPSSLADLVMGARQQPLLELEHDGVRFQGLSTSSELPFLLWPDARHVERLERPAHDRESTRRWLAELAPLLGHRDFQPRFESNATWRGNEVWRYGLTRAGLELYDARVEVHWREGELVGLLNQVPLPLVGVEERGPRALGEGDLVYYAERGPSGYRAVITERVVRVEGELLVTTVGPTTIYAPLVPPLAASLHAPVFDTWPVPLGSFPDQLDVDSNGKVWFSQPNDNWLTRFDPVGQTFTRFTTTGGSGPDGMMVDSQDRVWTGLYFSGALGVLNIQTGTHVAYAAPYGSAAMAIPVESRLGTIWVTDHQFNRISEFDPGTSQWVGSHVMPTANAWVVEGDLDPLSGTIWYTCYFADKLAFKPEGQPIQETATPPGGPAFPVWSNGKVYYTLWNDDALGCHDPSTGSHTLYQYPVPGEVGGPIGATANGRIVAGTRSDGYIMVFDPQTLSFAHYKIPTVFSGNLKDGLTVAPNGHVWFTETFANKLTRLIIP